MQANMIFHLHSTICYTPNEPSSRGKDTVQEVTKLPKTLCKVSLFNDLTGYSLHLLIAPGPALRQTAMLAACQKNAVFLSPRWVCTHRSLFAPVLSSAEIIPHGDRGDWETKSEFDTSEQQLFEASGKTNLCWNVLWKPHSDMKLVQWCGFTIWAYGQHPEINAMIHIAGNHQPNYLIPPSDDPIDQIHFFGTCSDNVWFKSFGPNLHTVYSCFLNKSKYFHSCHGKV